MQRNSDHNVSSRNPKRSKSFGDYPPNEQIHLTGHTKNFAKKYVDAIEQNALSRRVSVLSGSGKERNQRVDGSST